MARAKSKHISGTRTKSVKNGILIAVILVFLIAIIGSTYSRYVSTGNVSTTGQIAKWNIALNGNNLSETQNITVNAVAVEGISNENVSGNKIAPGRTLVADLEVDPTGTEVAVDYILSIGEIETEGFNTNSSIIISKVMVSLDNGVPVEIPLVNNEYKYYETLDDVLAGKEVKFSAYVLWDDVNNTADTANGTGAVTSVQVPITITAKQHLATLADNSKTLMVMAAETEQYDELILSEDITYDDYTEYPTSGWKRVEFADDAIFNLSGNTVTVPNGALAYVGNNLTIENGNFVGLISPASGRYGMHIWNDATTPEVSTGVVVQNVTTTGICLYNAEVTLRNVTVTMPDDAKYYTVYGNVYSTVTIESGTYTAGANTTALFGYLGYDNTEIGLATEDGRNPVDGFKIYGGTFNTNGKPFCLTSSNHIPPVIYGGTFDCDVSAYVASGHTCTNLGNGTWVVE